MRTLIMHVLPVGLSLPENITRRGALPDLRGVLADPRLSVHEQLSSATDRTTHDLDLDRILTPENRAAVRDAYSRLAAEWTSVAVHRTSCGANAAAEAFVLIASDTDKSLRAATLVAAQYADQNAIRFIAEPMAAPNPKIEPGEVHILRIPGLDLSSAQPNDDTWYSLGTAGHLIASTARMPPVDSRWQVVLHLTGGYKAMIPYLLVMAEGIKSVFRSPDCVTSAAPPAISAVTVHESSVDGLAGAGILVDIPVRWLDGSQFSDVRRLKRDVGDRSSFANVEYDNFIGHLIERNDANPSNRRRLTRAGQIMVKVV